MATVVGIINGRGLGMDTHHENKPNNSQLALYKELINCNSCLKQLYMSNKT